MNAAAELAGFFSAHAVWSVSDGETLVPIYGLEHNNDGRSMERLALDRLEDAVEAGKERLDENPQRAERAVLIFDGRINLECGKVDALIVKVLVGRETVADPIANGLRQHQPGPCLHRRDVGKIYRSRRIDIEFEIRPRGGLPGSCLHAANIACIDRASVVDIANEKSQGHRGRIYGTIYVGERDRYALRFGNVCQIDQDLIAKEGCGRRAGRYADVSGGAHRTIELKHYSVPAPNFSRLDRNVTCNELRRIDWKIEITHCAVSFS